ncbi:MAG TPA: ATP-binding protein, partial [Planctomycetaceae bacterium]|nr:ATP-binding protein [Planctomycetaceae bacterium]
RLGSRCHVVIRRPYNALMLADLRILATGLAAVIDTVLLLAMFERPNRRHVALWMFLLAGGAWLWHAGSFLHVLLEGTAELGLTGWRVPVRLVMAAGLLLMPSALLHGVLRLWKYGLAPRPRDLRLALPYLPIAALAPIAIVLGRGVHDEFLAAVSGWVGPYLVWLSVVNLVAAAAFLALAGRGADGVELRPAIGLPRADVFFRWMAGTLVALTLLTLFELLFARRAWPQAAEWLDLVVIVSPVAPALVFAYFVVRHRFAPLIVERTLIYGGILLALLLLHHVVVENYRNELSARYRIDLAIVEGILAVVLVLGYPPLRRRILDAVHNLLGSSPGTARRQVGALSVELSSRAGRPPAELFEWFVAALPPARKVDYAAAWLFDGAGQVHLRTGATQRLPDADVCALHAALDRSGARSCSWTDPPNEAAAGLLERGDGSLALVIDCAGHRGLLLLGRQALNQPPTDEELAALVLLVEQFAAALDNARLLAERRAADERAAQAEKLSMLGLLAGSIAHEVKNPLSSIKTLATVLAEELGPGHPHAADLALIHSEIDRLARTTSQLLEFARPPRGADSHASVAQALDRTLAVLRHLAREREVTIETRIADGLAAVSVGEPALREIFFNLVSNSIEAAGAGGRVHVGLRPENGCVVAEVHDTGPGLAPEVREHLFEPFVTTRHSGTGLGLYTVARRVREAGGGITCDSPSGQGTTFRIKLPCCDPNHQEAEP